ncbi:MAG: hypothetical protein MK171_01130 [Pirellulales bacterium]|nr:hypothetical protein [Pirellulales bacterium]
MAEHEVAADTPPREEATTDDVAIPFVGQWNRLVSTTNWEKGQIICQWREAMMGRAAPVTAYSDEVWAQRVGGVTSQHVGRLRRVSQRFGDVAEQYQGLYWSHFQAALDWDDAEMWLEGSLQNEWSVSQMRGKRWETLGMPADEQQAAAAQDQAEGDREAAAEGASSVASEAESAVNGDDSSVSLAASAGSAPETQADTDSAPNETSEFASGGDGTEPIQQRTHLHVKVESLPDDLAEAFESFKLAIIAHRREGWRDTTPESVVECLNALKELAMVEG